MKLFKQKQNKESSFNDKVIVNTIVTSLGISAHDDVLAVSHDSVLCDALKKQGASVQLAVSAVDIDGGEFDYVFLFNIPISDIVAELSAATTHLTENGCTVVLNTENKFDETAIKKAACGNLESVVINDEFALAVIR